MENISEVVAIMEKEYPSAIIKTVWSEGVPGEGEFSSPFWHIYTYKESHDGLLGIEIAVTPRTIGRLKESSVKAMARLVDGAFSRETQQEDRGDTL